MIFMNSRTLLTFYSGYTVAIIPHACGSASNQSKKQVYQIDTQTFKLLLR